MSAMNRGAKRSRYDSYQTPWYVVEAIMSEFQWDRISTFLEPCKGEGRILTSVPKGVRRHWAELQEGRDYLTYKPKVQEFDLIVTNPPFSLALEFLMKSLSEAKTVAYLLRNNWLGSVERAEFFQNNNPDYLWTIGKRPSFTMDDDGKWKTDACEYSWMIWDRGGLVVPGHPTFRTIATSASKKEPFPCPGIILPPSLRAREARHTEVREVAVRARRRRRAV